MLEQTYFFNFIKISKFFFLSMFLIAFSNYGIAEEDDSEDQDEVTCFSRLAFPTTCKLHFANNAATAHTWVEADDAITIASFNKYLQFIPKIYPADCSQCFDCNGVKFNMYNEIDWPTDIEAFDELVKCHKQSAKGWGQYCKKDNDHCQNECWNGGYFRRWNHEYIHFFNHFLQYCSENRKCHCYWPENDSEAASVNNKVYELFKNLADAELISADFSSYWNANSIEFNTKEKFFADDYYPNSHGMASSLATYTFFYSQYHQTLLAVAGFIDANSVKGNPKAIDRIYNTLERIRLNFTNIYNRCLGCHPHPKIYYERGLLRMHSGQYEDALSDINRLMRLAETDKYKNDVILSSDIYQQEGQVYADLGMYDKAIHSLNKAINLDPNNRGAYFSRAQAYFETGQFEQALDDYLVAKADDKTINAKLKPSRTVKESILKGLTEGSKEAAVDFGPSLCESVYGLGCALWGFAEHPIDSTVNFVNACYDISKNAREFFKGIDWKDIESCSVEIERLYGNFDKLSETEKGYLVAYAIGKYGVDIFAGTVALKSIVTFKKLKEANKLCNLEAMSTSPVNKEKIIASALKHESQREVFFKNIKVHVDKQNKHIPGKHNYVPGKSIFEHSDPQRLLNNFAGKGRPLGNRTPGCLDYREKVNFGEFIGYHVNNDTQVKTAATWGEIRYSKKDAHIVPSLPDLEGL